MPAAPNVALSSPRDVPLEALRGMAALVVIAWHFLLGLAPSVLSDPGYGIAGTPFLAFVHGSAAVCVFFVLSGFVLTRRYFETGNKRILAAGALKRWFRLFLPVFLSIMLSWLLFHFNLYAYEDAGRLSDSGWLMTFGFAMHPPFDPTFVAALEDAFIQPLTHHDEAFNPLLWTIHIELMGSYIAYAFAGFITGLRGRTELIALATLLLALTIYFIEPFLIGFLPGTLLALYAPRLKGIKPVTAYGLLTLGIVFLGYREPVGFYSFLDFLRPINGEPLRACIATTGAVLVMVVFIGYEPLRRRLNGVGARLLGRLSFPLYLVHIILIASLGSAVFVLASEGNGPGVALAITALVLIPAILALAAVFAVIDTKWVAYVNRTFRKLKISG